MEIINEISEVIPNDKISVIVPAYNNAQDLPACLDSILNQSYHNIEIVIVNDGSTDITGEVISSYQEKYPHRITAIYQNNSGAAAARFRGIENASGAWIGFVDADDVIESDMYERLINNAKQYHADISHCGYQTIVNGGERVHYFYNMGKIVCQDHATGVKDLLEGSFIEPSLCNKLFRKDLFRNLPDKSRFMDLRINEDLLLNFYLFSNSDRSIYEDFCPYHYLARVTSASRSAFQAYKVLDPIKVYEIILSDITEEQRETVEKRYILSCMNAFYSLYERKENIEEMKMVRDRLLSCKKSWRKLNKYNRSKLYIMAYCPKLYSLLYKVYTNTLQQKVYE